MWDIRNRGVIPPGALPRVRAFADLADGTGATTTTTGEEQVSGSELAALSRAHELFAGTTRQAALDVRVRRI